MTLTPMTHPIPDRPIEGAALLTAAAIGQADPDQATVAKQLADADPAAQAAAEARAAIGIRLAAALSEEAHGLGAASGPRKSPMVLKPRRWTPRNMAVLSGLVAASVAVVGFAGSHTR